MKKILGFIALALLLGLRIQQNSNATVSQVEAIIRGSIISLVLAVGYYFFFYEQVWVSHRHLLIKRFGHIGGILSHYIIGQAAWAMGMAITTAMWDIFHTDAFPVMLVSATIVAIVQCFLKMEALKHIYTEGIPVDLIGLTIYNDRRLMFWDGTQFINIKGGWWMSKENGKIEFRVKEKEDIQILELWNFRVIGQK